MWSQLAEYFGVEAAAYPGHPTPLEAQMAADAAAWAEIAKANGLVEPDLRRLTSAWHTDADLGRPMEVMADMTKSRRLGFRRSSVNAPQLHRPLRPPPPRTPDSGGREAAKRFSCDSRPSSSQDEKKPAVSPAPSSPVPG